MNLFKKGFVLLIALIFPLVIFLFLKFFGENKYDLNSYNSSCSEIIENNIIKDFNNKNTIKILDIRLSKKDVIIDNYIRKLEFEDEIEVITLSNKLRNLNWLNITVDNETIQNLSSCVIGLNFNESFILLFDKNNIVRGYFNSAERADIERLAVELDILIFENE